MKIGERTARATIGSTMMAAILVCEWLCVEAAVAFIEGVAVSLAAQVVCGRLIDSEGTLIDSTSLVRDGDGLVSVRIFVGTESGRDWPFGILDSDANIFEGSLLVFLEDTFRECLEILEVNLADLFNLSETVLAR